MESDGAEGNESETASSRDPAAGVVGCSSVAYPFTIPALGSPPVREWLRGCVMCVYC
jgi:hypothetical protein